MTQADTVVEKVDAIVPSRFFIIKSTINPDPKAIGPSRVIHRVVFGPAHKADIDAWLGQQSSSSEVAAYLIAEDVTHVS